MAGPTDTLSACRTAKDAANGVGHVPPQLIFLMDCERPLEPSSRHLLRSVDRLEIGRAAQRTVSRDQRGLRLSLPDRWLSSKHAALQREHDVWRVCDLESKNHTYLNGERVDQALLLDGDVIEVGRSFFLFRDQTSPAMPDRPDLHEGDLPASLALRTFSGPLADALARFCTLAPTDVSVLVLGPTGSGKELLARALHALSGRPGRFVAVNCGAISEGLLESELFGHRKGAFSGAGEDRPGLIRASDRGTLFLDEIGDLSMASQAALLRVLQEKEVRPVGDTDPVPVKLRVVAATHRNLTGLVQEGRFREDLFARLAGFTVRLPPLADRPEDVGLLIRTLLTQALGTAVHHVSLAPSAAHALLRYAWPANMRELEHCLSAAAALAGGARIEATHLPSVLTADPTTPRPFSMNAEPRLTEAQQRHRDELAALLHEHRGNVSAVARVVGKARMQVHRWIKRYRLDVDVYRR